MLLAKKNEFVIVLLSLHIPFHFHLPPPYHFFYLLSFFALPLLNGNIVLLILFKKTKNIKFYYSRLLQNNNNSLMPFYKFWGQDSLSTMMKRVKNVNFFESKTSILSCHESEIQFAIKTCS
jgi:hypothetical protein